MSAPDPVRGTHNLADLVRMAALARPDAPALLAGDVVVTWADLDAAVTAFASGLLRQGLAAGDRVALMLGNGPPFVVTYFGVLRAGLVAVPMNIGYTVREVAELLDQADPRLVVAERATVDVARSAAGGQAQVVVVGDSSYDTIMHAGLRADATPPPDPSTFDPATLAVLLFTAGTSGRPKGAMLTHRALLANLGQLLRVDPPPMRRDDVVLVVLPLFHVYALNAVLGLAAAVGAACVLVERFEPDDALELVRRHSVTNIPGAPPIFVAWSRRDDLHDALAGVQTLASGAAPLAPAVLAVVAGQVGRPVWEGYGMTEAAPVVASTLVSGRPKPGSVGRPLPGVEVRLVDDDGELADDGDPGEVEVRGPNLFEGYWPDRSGGPGPDGWWRTGDVAYADEDGDLHLVDRRRDLVLVSGFNVYPFEVETMICTHPDVAEAAVIGVPDEDTGSSVKAFVVPLTGHDVTVADVLEHCRARLARFKCPSAVEIVPSLPHSTSGKVVRARLRDGWTGD